LRIEHVESTHMCTCDSETGLPNGLTFRGSGRTESVSISCSLSIQIGGTEQRAATGGLEYVDTHTYESVRRVGDVISIESATGMAFCVPVEFLTTADPIRASLTYRLNRFGPAVSFGLHVPGGQSVVVRNVRLNATFALASGVWLVTAPGNCLASGTPLQVVSVPIGVSPIGGLRGSSGLIHLEAVAGPSAVAVWVDDDTEVPEIEFSGTSSNSMELRVVTNFSADLSGQQSNDINLFSLDLSVPRWSSFPAAFDGWMRSRGLTSPGKPPEWSIGALIYEAQIGFSVFNEVHRYSPYPDVDDLIADLDRIQRLGFSVIQLMPRQPYPSYNVHDYWDIDTSYGAIGLIKELVQQAHARNIRVIFDVLLHGVLDQESIEAAADGVRSGPFAALLSSETSDSFGTDVKDWQNYLIAWSRHIADFEPYWKAGSPPVSPLIAEHPDWFCRDSNGGVSGVYTKAFDARNRDWQDYFTRAMSFLMTELDIDGFRFDAPTYNEFANWAPWARGRASTSQLGCVGLFERLRPTLKSIKADSLLYTEPSGHALRRSMDLNYNYDEQWLLTALANPESATAWGVSTGKGLARWMRDRDAVLPHGSLTAHHIDSHDTFWWPSWGKKWRREQFTMDQVRLLTVIFGGLPGPMMMFSGGEVGIEDLLPALAELKRGDVWRYGAVSWWDGDDTPENVFGITRTLGTAAVSLVANVGPEPVSFVAAGGIVPTQVVMSVGTQSTVDNGRLALGINSTLIFTHTK
jgi:Alpha amylase, catalytic domain